MDNKVFLCKDCVHFSQRTEECLAQVKMDYVYGNKGFYKAVVQREYASSCGPSANWFQPMRTNHLTPEEQEELSCVPWDIAIPREIE